MTLIEIVLALNILALGHVTGSPILETETGNSFRIYIKQVTTKVGDGAVKLGIHGTEKFVHYFHDHINGGSLSKIRDINGQFQRTLLPSRYTMGGYGLTAYAIDRHVIPELTITDLAGEFQGVCTGYECTPNKINSHLSYHDRKSGEYIQNV